MECEGIVAGDGMRGKRVDSNQAAIVKALRKIPGVSARSTAGVGDDFTDIIVGYKRRNYIFEVKRNDVVPSKQRLRPGQQKFKDGWHGQCDTITSLDDVLSAVGITQ